MKDVFEMFRVIARERKRRELDPTSSVLRDCIEETSAKPADAYTHERLLELLSFFELSDAAHAQLERLPTPALVKLARMGDKALRLLGAKPR
jgi:DNA-binding transcriptional regulator GbsR (MarR family)